MVVRRFLCYCFFFFFFNDTATTEIYTISLHDALPISRRRRPGPLRASLELVGRGRRRRGRGGADRRRGLHRLVHGYAPALRAAERRRGLRPSAVAAAASGYSNRLS